MAGTIVAGTLEADTWKNSDGTENYKCRAWVNFDGTGTVTIRASGNVSSITDNGTGDYTANFINPMPDTNYVVSGGASGITTQARSATVATTSTATNPPQLMTTSACRIVYGGNGVVDGYVTTMAFFR